MNVHAIAGAALALLPLLAQAADQPQWGEWHTRNMVSTETGLPVDFDPETGRNVAWSAPLGGNAYGTPVIAGGKVLVGANNDKPRDPRMTTDYGILLCLNESDGSLDWQLAVPRTAENDDYLDWPMIGMCASPTVEGRRAYMVTNRYEVVCLDLDGQRNGNDGPYLDEGQHMAMDGQPALEVTPTDADIIWRFSLPEGAGIYRHDQAHSAILLDGDYLYLNSCNGVDNTHRVIRKPEAPSLVVLNKHTGALVAQDAEGMGAHIFHATWTPPALGVAGGERLVIFGGPDGVCYAFKALEGAAGEGAVRNLERVWRYDGDPTAPKENVAEYLENRKVSPSVIEGMPVILGERVYITLGGDVWWGKEQSWLQCIDASKRGDLTAGGPLWSYEMKAHCCATPAVYDGMVFVGDSRGNVHCVDAETGAGLWTHDMLGEIWGSALVADGKVYVGSRGKQFCVFAAKREKEVLATVKVNAPISSTPVAANGRLYVNTLTTLYALKQ